MATWRDAPALRATLASLSWMLALPDLASLSRNAATIGVAVRVSV